MSLLEIGFLCFLGFCLVTEKNRKISSFFVRFTFYFLLLHFETKIWFSLFNLPVPIPRSLEEILNRPDKFEKLLKKNHVLSKQEKIINLQKLAAVSSEPKKQTTAGSLKIIISNTQTAGKRELDVFCKFQTGKGMPIWLQAVRCAAEPGVSREIDFYSQIAPSVPIRTIKCHLSLKLSMINYVFLMLDYVDLENHQARVINDQTGATLSEVSLMMTEVAKLHKQFANVEEPEVAWIPARKGLEFAQWVESFGVKTDPIWNLQVWSALKTYFLSRPVTLIHGDCRPGNMLFEGSNRDNVSGVIFADWEATNIGPFLWDFTYCTTLGWPAASRREFSKQVLSCYLKSLNQQQEVPIQPEIEIALLTLVLGFVSRTIRKTGFWENQGNNRGDQISWFVRVALSIKDIDSQSVATSLGLAEKTILDIQRDSYDELLSSPAIAEKIEQLDKI